MPHCLRIATVLFPSVNVGQLSAVAFSVSPMIGDGTLTTLVCPAGVKGHSAT